MNQSDSIIDVSICIPTHQAREVLHGCLQSIQRNTHLVSYELIVVDNCSHDGTIEMVTREFPGVRLVCNDYNAGFTKPINQSLAISRGRYILLLNNDTKILPHAIDRLVQFADQQPEAGIIGPKVLNTDGSFQKQCRRTFGSPWSSLSYKMGLFRIFPRSVLFNGYVYGYLDENTDGPVDAVSGSCMLIRRQVIDDIGLLDETYYAYWEDSDYCFRAQRAGWHVLFFAGAQIIHYTGMGGSHANPCRSIYEWHRSHHIFYRRYLAPRYFFLVNWIYIGLIWLRWLFVLLSHPFRKRRFTRLPEPNR